MGRTESETCCTLFQSYFEERKNEKFEIYKAKSSSEKENVK